MKFGDAVIYDEFGKKYNAIVLGGRDLTGDKPFVNLAFARATTDMSGKPQDLSGTGSWTKMIQNRHDVAHESVLTIDGPDGKPVIYAGGRWAPIPINIAPEPTPVKWTAEVPNMPLGSGSAVADQTPEQVADEQGE